MIDAIALKFQTGTQGVHLPEKYGNWQDAHNRLRMRAVDGTWERAGNAKVPYDHREAPGPYPLGAWVAEQRRANGVEQMTGQRAARLENLGMVWSVADERFQENLAAARVYYEQAFSLCAPRTATALDRPLGQWLSNLRGRTPATGVRQRRLHRPGPLHADPLGRIHRSGRRTDHQPHHSFLPAFIGAGPYAKAKERGVKLVGATAHYVTEDRDEGPIIEQDVMRVTHAHTAAELQRRGTDVERAVLSRAVEWHSQDRVIRDGNHTIVFA